MIVICRETSEMISKFKKLSSKLVSCIHLRTFSILKSEHKLILYVNTECK